MTLIAMAVYDTEENKRTEYTQRTIDSVLSTTSRKHPFVVIDNNSCEATKKLLHRHASIGHIQVITLKENVGTAKAVNMGWKLRTGHAIKMDNDVVIHQKGWIEMMEEAIEQDPSIGIIGLKRKDCWEKPNHPSGHYRSEMKLLGGDGKRWIPIEKVNHVMGTCHLFNAALLDKIGYLYQPRLYGFDDALAAVRCQVAGFYSCFLHGIEIDHIDTGETAYQGWKEKHSLEDMETYNMLKNAYLSGNRSIYSEATW